jgi:predicted  nucleic acid-binding Zn-ribbon protein
VQVPPSPQLLANADAVMQQLSRQVVATRAELVQIKTDVAQRAKTVADLAARAAQDVGKLSKHRIKKHGKARTEAYQALFELERRERETQARLEQLETELRPLQRARCPATTLQR